MVDSPHHTERLDAIFHALADPTRRRIVGALTQGPHTIGELARPFPVSLAAVSKHVKVLERARLVRRRVRGRQHVCSLDPAALAGARDWIERQERFWTERLDALEALLTEESRSGSSPKPSPRSPARGSRAVSPRKPKGGSDG